MGSLRADYVAAASSKITYLLIVLVLKRFKVIYNFRVKFPIILCRGNMVVPSLWTRKWTHTYHETSITKHFGDKAGNRI